MAIQFHQEMKDRDYPTKEPVRNPQQSNEQANPMGQLEKKSVSGSYRIDSETAIRSAAAPRASSEIRQGSCPLCGNKHATETIAMECHVSAGGLGSYLRRYWRELVLHRHRIPLEGENPHAVKIMSEGKPNVVSHARYKRL